MAQERYRHNFNDKLRKHKGPITVGDSDQLHIERGDINQHWRKLAALAQTFYAIIKLKGKPVVIQLKYKTVARVSRENKSKAPTACTTEKVHHVTNPMSAKELTSSMFPTSKTSKRSRYYNSEIVVRTKRWRVTSRPKDKTVSI